MKKVALLFSLCLCGCAQEAIDDDMVVENTTIEMSIEEPVGFDLDTRLVSQSASFKYNNGDKFGVCPVPKTSADPLQSQIAFSVSGLSAPSSSVSINAGAWTTKPGNEFVSYMPYSLFNEDPRSIPVSFEGQTQTENNSSAHFANNALIASLPVAGENGKFNFSNKYMGSFMRFTITSPATATYTKMVLESSKSDQFALSGTYNLIDKTNDQPFTAKKTSKSLTLNLSNISVSSGGTLTLWMMAQAPIDYRNNTFTIYLYTSSGQYYKCTSTFPTLTNDQKQRGHNKGISVSLPDSGKSFVGPETDNSLGTLTGVIE